MSECLGSILRRWPTGVLVPFFLAVAVKTLGCTGQGKEVKSTQGVLNFVEYHATI